MRRESVRSEREKNRGKPNKKEKKKRTDGSVPHSKG